jgi:hypothetical protein
MFMKNPIIALVTDFGTEDGYVGAMKGRILSICPEANVIDISHNIPPYDVRRAAFCLNNCYPYFPDKAIFVAVVDPGVGSHRNGLVVKTSQHHFVGPDNGIFSFVYRREGYQASEIRLKAFSEDISATFHGRDVFSRVAAWIAAGRDLDKYLKPLKEVESFLKPPQKITEHEFLPRIIHIDHFGNLILDFHKNDLRALENVSQLRVRFQDIELTEIDETFASVEEGEMVLTWDSSDFLQIAQNMGSAAKKLNAAVGDQLKLLV